MTDDNDTEKIPSGIPEGSGSQMFPVRINFTFQNGSGNYNWDRPEFGELFARCDRAVYDLVEERDSLNKTYLGVVLVPWTPKLPEFFQLGRNHPDSPVAGVHAIPNDVMDDAGEGDK